MLAQIHHQPSQDDLMSTVLVPQTNSEISISTIVPVPKDMQKLQRELELQRSYIAELEDSLEIAEKVKHSPLGCSSSTVDSSSANILDNLNVYVSRNNSNSSLTSNRRISFQLNMAQTQILALEEENEQLRIREYAANNEIKDLQTQLKRSKERVSAGEKQIEELEEEMCTRCEYIIEMESTVQNWKRKFHALKAEIRGGNVRLSTRNSKKSSSSTRSSKRLSVTSEESKNLDMIDNLDGTIDFDNLQTDPESENDEGCRTDSQGVNSPLTGTRTSDGKMDPETRIRLQEEELISLREEVAELRTLELAAREELRRRAVMSPLDLDPSTNSDGNSLDKMLEARLMIAESKVQSLCVKEKVWNKEKTQLNKLKADLKHKTNKVLKEKEKNELLNELISSLDERVVVEKEHSKKVEEKLESNNKGFKTQILDLEEEKSGLERRFDEEKNALEKQIQELNCKLKQEKESSK